MARPTPCILIVDDEPRDRMLVRRSLEVASQFPEIDIHEAESGANGLELYEELRPDLVILDQYLTDTNGVEVLRDLAGDCRTARTSVILLTASGGEDLVLNVMKLGASDYLNKSQLGNEVVAHRVAHCLRTLDLQREVVARRAQVTESERRFRALANNAPVLVWMSEANGSVTYCNQPMLDFTGTQLADHIGDGWLKSIHEDDREARRELHRNSHERNEGFESVHRIRRADGIYATIIEWGEPMRNASGRPIGFVGSCVDTARVSEAARRHEIDELIA